jgi:hypothetical protein
MKKLAVFALIVFLGTSMSMAQNRGGQRDFNPEDMAKRQTEELKEALGLDKAQEKKVYAINLKAGNEMKEIRDNAGGDRDVMREKMTKVRDDSNKELKKVLSEDQWKKYEKYQEERRGQRGQRGQGGQRGGGSR